MTSFIERMQAALAAIESATTDEDREAAKQAMAAIIRGHFQRRTREPKDWARAAAGERDE